MVRRLKENKVTGILTALLVGIVMFVGMGTMKVNANEETSQIFKKKFLGK